MATTPYTGYTSSDQPATVTTTPISPVIDAGRIGSTTSPVIPAPVTVPDTTYTAPLASISASTQASVDSNNKQIEADQKAKEADSKMSDANILANQIAGLESQKGGIGQDRANLMATGGANTAYNRLQDINAQLTGINNSNQAIPIQNRLNYQGSAGTENQVQNVNRDQLAQNALKALSLGQEAAIAEGNYNKAKNLADQQVDIKYAQITADIESKKTQLAALKDFVLTPAQEKAKSAQEQALKKQEQEYQEKKMEEKTINELMGNAYQIAPPDVIARAEAIKAAGGNSNKIAQALGVYGEDYLKNQLLKEQLKTEQAQRSKIYADMGKAGTANVGTVSTPGALQNAVANLKLTEAQSKALAFGQRAINADRALQERLKTYDPTTVFSATGRLLSTDNARAFKRDMGDFITAVLRKESGATITEDEFDRFIPIYSPQGIMTNQNDVAQTNLKRQGAIDALISEAGPASAALASYKNSAGAEAQAYQSSNPELNAWYQSTNKAATTATTAQTNTYGYTDK